MAFILLILLWLQAWITLYCLTSEGKEWATSSIWRWEVCVYSQHQCPPHRQESDLVHSHITPGGGVTTQHLPLSCSGKFKTCWISEVAETKAHLPSPCAAQSWHHWVSVQMWLPPTAPICFTQVDSVLAIPRNNPDSWHSSLAFAIFLRVRPKGTWASPLGHPAAFSVVWEFLTWT